MPVVSVDQFKDLAITLYKAAGATDEEANVVTDCLLYATLRGHDSHGAGHLAQYLRGFMGGRGFTVNRNANIRVLNDTPCTYSVDGDYYMGQKVTMDATQKVIEKAKQMGIAAATVTNCTHNGSLGFYTDTIAKHHMIGIATTCSQNASPPWGGIEPFLGTNPISFAIPAKDEYPIVIDMATSSTTWRGLNPLLQSDQPIPWGWLLDEQGEVTTDREKFAPRQGRGAMANFGNNHKGYALQLAVEMLGGILPGLLTGHTVATERGLNSPSLIMAINISFFQDVDAFEEKVAQRIREIRASKKKPGVDAIYLPGERGMQIMEKRLKEGFNINEGYWNEIKEVAEQLGVPMPKPSAAVA